MNQSVALLHQLIPFSSVSSTSNIEISRWVEGQLQQRGFDTEWIEYVDRAGVTKACVAGRLGPSTGRGLVYSCHTDVVPAGSWSYPHAGPWQPDQRDDRIYGRGSCDMKGSLACMLAAVESIDPQSLQAPLCIIATADEEVGLVGAAEVVRQSEIYRDIVDRQGRCVVGEPTMLNVVHAHKGGRIIQVVAHGVAAHSSTNDGVNANLKMIPFLHQLRELHEETVADAKWHDDRFDPPTSNLNISMHDNNNAFNMTAAESVCTMYFRTMPAVDADELTHRVRDLADSYDLDFEMMFSADPLFTSPDSEFVYEVLEISGTSTSHTVAYGTDGACFSEIKDIVVFGPGSIDQAHTDDEWISLDQLEKGTRAFSTMIRRWCVEG